MIAAVLIVPLSSTIYKIRLFTFSLLFLTFTSPYLVEKAHFFHHAKHFREFSFKLPV